jgi:hypothetical protein
MRDRILKLLSTPMHFLIYRGGAGGEFLSKQVYKYSSIYHNELAVSKDIEGVNKTLIMYPNFFNSLMSIPQNTNNVADVLASIENETNIIQAEEYLKSYPSFPLFRGHYINNMYFRYRSFFVFLDEERWWHYAGLLVSLKNKLTREILTNPLIGEHYIRYDLWNDFIEDDATVSKIKDFMDSNSLINLSNIYPTLAMNKTVRNNETVEDILNYNITALYEKYHTVLYGEYSLYQKIINKPFMKLIKFSKYFDKGYLEDMLEIDSPNFHFELIEWHEKNLELMSINGVDIGKFKLS